MALLFDPLYLALEFCWQGVSRILLWKEEDEDVYLVKVKFALEERWSCRIGMCLCYRREERVVWEGSDLRNGSARETWVKYEFITQSGFVRRAGGGGGGKFLQGGSSEKLFEGSGNWGTNTCLAREQSKERWKQQLCASSRHQSREFPSSEGKTIKSVTHPAELARFLYSKDII